MTLQEQIAAIIAEDREARIRTHGTLRTLIQGLEQMPQDATLLITPINAYPTGLDSYRGYYADLAIEYTAVRPDTKGLTVGELLEKARNAVGATFTGYKGGEFVMDEDTPIWISPYGLSENMRLESISLGKDGVVELNAIIVED